MFQKKKTRGHIGSCSEGHDFFSYNFEIQTNKDGLYVKHNLRL